MTTSAAAADYARFAEGFVAGQGQVLWRERVADLETPVGAFLKLAAGRPNSFLLESVEGGSARGRYSAIGLDPDFVWRCRGGRAEVNRHALAAPHAFEPEDGNALDSLRRAVAAVRLPLPAGLPPMATGLFGYLAYDMVRLMERLPQPNRDALGLPDAVLVRPTVMVVFDAVRDEISLVTPVRPERAVSPKAAYETALARLERVMWALERPLPLDERRDPPGLDLGSPRSNTSEAEFAAMVEQAKEYIRAGDVFQVVLSQRFESEFPLPAFALYRSLRRVNPAPFLCYLDFQGFQIVCSSPEILVRLREGVVTIRPIAGTRPRGATAAEDKRYADELLADPKERAEHLMLLDLGRNDVGRVSRLGSVTVTDSFFLEFYSQVMHIVSNVEGRLDPRYDALEALVAGFPAGTVSGAPKVRAMEIIDELEKEKRGPYAGAIGYFGANGEMDTCIVLRTAVVKDGRMSVQAGAGIVYDSDPAFEQQECVNKAKALFRAAEDAVRFASRARRGQ
jgi:anthranilate synthase component 1